MREKIQKTEEVLKKIEKNHFNLFVMLYLGTVFLILYIINLSNYPIISKIFFYGFFFCYYSIFIVISAYGIIKIKKNFENYIIYYIIIGFIIFGILTLIGTYIYFDGIKGVVGLMGAILIIFLSKILGNWVRKFFNQT